MAAVVVIGDGRGLTVEMCCRNQRNRSKLSLYTAVTFTLTILLNSCTQATRWNVSVIKVGVVCMGIRILRPLKEELAWAMDKCLQVVSNKMLYLKQLYH